MINREPTEFARFLKKWRARHGYAQPDAAKVLGVPLPNIRAWEQSVSVPSLSGLAIELLGLLDKFDAIRKPLLASRARRGVASGLSQKVLRRPRAQKRRTGSREEADPSN